MKLFNFLKNTKNIDSKPDETIKRMIDFMPEFYKSHQQFKNCAEFSEHREWDFALDSLIALADETKHYFSEDFWLGLADAADKMKMEKQANYCRKQIQNNLIEIKFKIPFGWTTVKIDDTHFEQHISEKLKLQWATNRREKDNVQNLINTDGIHLKSNGRNGYIYYVEKEKVTEIEYELGVKGLILWFDSVDSWVLPTKQRLTKDEKIKIKNIIEDWGAQTKNALDFT